MRTKRQTKANKHRSLKAGGRHGKIHSSIRKRFYVHPGNRYTSELKTVHLPHPQRGDSGLWMGPWRATRTEGVV